MEGIEIPQGMEEGLSKKEVVPQRKEISKERRGMRYYRKQKKEGLERRSILEQHFD